MQHFVLKKHHNHLEIFSGDYLTFVDCLEDAVQKNIDLSGVDLKNKNLSNANLDGAYMPRAILNGANLTGANFSECNLEYSVFYDCSFYNTCLSYSNLRNSDFRGASFGATLIEGANIQNCIFSTLSCFDLDFCLTENMDGCLFSCIDGELHKMSRYPIVLKGLMSTHIIILDDSIKIGAKIFPKTLLPMFLQILAGKHIHLFSESSDSEAIAV